MPDLPINIIKGDKVGSETDYRDYLPINMSAVIRPLLGASGYMLQQPGLTQYAEGIGIDRGGLYNERQSNHFRISGTSFIEVDVDGTVTTLGTVSGNDTVSLPYSFNTQGIVANGKFFLYDTTNGFREVTDSDLGDPIDCVWVDGYYFFTDGEFIYHTDLVDESSIDPLKFATSEYSPDPTLGVALTPDNKVMVFNRYSIEYFINVATDNFAFTRVVTRAVKAGIVGTHCKAEILDQWFIMGGRKEEDVAIHAVGVGTVTKISSREVDKVINQYTEAQLSTAVLEARVEDDYQYLIVHLPNEVLLYNVKVGGTLGYELAWSILKTDVLGDDPWRAKFGLFEPRKGEWVYGDKLDATIGILDNTVATQYGEIAEWVLKTPFIYLESQSVDQLDIEIIPGFTTTSDATVFLSLSYDGFTYGTEFPMEYGAPSAFNNRFIANRLGYVRNWVGFKLRGATRSRMAFSRGLIRYG